ncbi:MAG: SPX domain protein involved in polyphosphate accumulation [Maribacter sp.]|jgi:SPX domain protein involved in polyphosphate accumulation
MRYERKYRITASDLAVVLQVVRNHPASFRKIFPDRQVNNVYWDTLGLQTYHDNVMGIAERQKFRIRWYGTDVTKSHKPKLEIKKRINELGDKDIFKINDFDLKDINSLSDEVANLTKVNTNLIPVLLSSYKRSYWGTSDQKFRITVDYQMQFHSIMNDGKFRKYAHMDRAIVLELKYDEEDEFQVDRIAQFIPFRKTKNSKYVIGVEHSNGWLV